MSSAKLKMQSSQELKQNDKRLRSVNSRASRMRHEMTEKLLDNLQRQKQADRNLEKRLAQLEHVVGQIGGKVAAIESSSTAQSQDLQVKLTSAILHESKRLGAKISKLEKTSAECEVRLQTLTGREESLEA